MRSRLVIHSDGTREWIRIDETIISEKKKMNAQGEDLTIDGYIDKYGGIRSNADDKVYTTKQGYLNSIKAKGLEIKDW